jgi:hypothetical protein
MTPHLYAIWQEAWCREHPAKVPPTLEQVRDLMEMFDITAKEIFGLCDDRRYMRGL